MFVLGAAADAWQAISNQPRAQGEQVLAILDTEWERTSGLIASVVDELREQRPLDKDEATARAHCLLQYAGDWFEWDEAAQIIVSVEKLGSAAS